jgi:cytochrome P450
MTMTEPQINDPRAAIFLDPVAYTDQEAWHAVAAELRRDDPVLRVEAEGYTPFYVLTRFADVFEVSRHNDTFLNTRNSVLGPDFQGEYLRSIGVEPATLIHMDGEEHRGHRALTNGYFRPTAVAKRQEAITQIAREYMAKFRDLGGECDFAQEIAVPYTLRVIMSIFGVPIEDEPTMLRLTQGIFGAADPEYLGDFVDPQALLTQTIQEFDDYFNALARERRNTPRDDLASVIANGEVDGCPMGRDQTLWYFIIVATAGHDTTSFALSGGVEALTRRPEQYRALREDRGLLVEAVDEMIRYTSPVRAFLRYLSEDAVVGGTELRAGERLLLSYPAANRDEAIFEQPQSFDVNRKNASRLISFGGGEHFCLGSTFARRELRTMIPVMLDEISELEFTGTPEWSQANFVGGVKHLPIRARFA